MRKPIWPIIAADALLAVFVVAALVGLNGTPAAAQVSIPIQVSPSAIILSSEHSAPVTVHADIGFYAVVNGSVELSCDQSSGVIKPFMTFPDDRGELVAKFYLSEVESILGTISGRVNVTFKLTGTKTDQTLFEGEDQVTVRKNPPN